MFSISHGPDGSFRLEIHSPPSELDPAEARRLRGVLIGLAREVRPEDGGDGEASRPMVERTERPDDGESDSRRVVADTG